MSVPILGATEDDMIIRPWIKHTYAEICSILGPSTGKDAATWCSDKKLEITTPVPLQEFLFLLGACKKLRVAA